MHRLKYCFACALTLAAAAACSSNNTPTTPSTPATGTIDYTDAINGPLTPHGAQTFTFNVLTAGTVSLELVDLQPDGPNGAAVGLELGVADSITNCQSVVSKDNALISTSVIAQATTAGNLCARIYDATGTLTQPQMFHIQVTIPQ